MAALEIEFQLYRITCSVSGKSYIGQTRQTIERRWVGHTCKARNEYTDGCSALYSAMRNHGIENFSMELLETVSSQEEANRREGELIAELGTLTPGGYNLKTGGEISGHSEETKEKIGRSNRNHRSRLGKKHSPETLAKMRAAATHRKGKPLFNLTPEQEMARRGAISRGRRGF